MKHYKNLMSALGDAMPVCLAWRLAGTEDNYFNARDMFAFALSDEEDGSLKEGQFYVVSKEGAIGISSGYEYLVKWLFIPLEGNTYDREVLRLKQELENDTKSQPEPERVQYQANVPTQGMGQPYAQPQGVGQQGMGQSNIPPQGMGQSNIPPQGMGQSNIPPQGMGRPNIPPQVMGQPNISPQGMPQPNIPPQSMGQQNVPPQGMPQPNEQPQAGQRLFCPKCGYKLGPTSRFCPGCGAPVRR